VNKLDVLCEDIEKVLNSTTLPLSQKESIYDDFTSKVSFVPSRVNYFSTCHLYELMRRLKEEENEDK
jgi:hypothetical protein